MTMSSSKMAGLCNAGVAAAAASFLFSRSPAFAEKTIDTSFLFPSLSSHSAPATAAATSATPAPPPPPQREESRPRNDAPRTTAAGFDPEALERGAKALREINSSMYAKKVFELMRKQEETRQAEEVTRKTEYQALQAQHETERQRVMYDEQKKLVQQQAQTKAQLARYEDELARKRMQAEHEAQRIRNAEMVKLQEEATARQEQARRSTEEHIQAQRRQTEKEKAEIERETIRVRVLAEAEGRAHEARLAEDVNRRLLLERANVEKEKWLAAINTTFSHIGGGLRAILTDRDKLVVAVGGVTALAAGVYTTREGARVLWSYVDRILGQPSLVRESSRGKYPWSRWIPQRTHLMSSASQGKKATEQIKSGNGFGEVILSPPLQKRVQQLASATANTKQHIAPFRNMLFYGPPGTGKTMAAKELARTSVIF
ncbi:hypothetical protein O6H91_10G015100 [Diphasiastrum complanatum]|uniref:Uncharacterized protein n=1 Tax=Diphasiastrum complanatum TaxID=34168 RepID=A0ACC2CEP8_DIPCM|nr:hypothetical protein O6H91_10G015100 [Diphasiastrum complanatum]